MAEFTSVSGSLSRILSPDLFAFVSRSQGIPRLEDMGFRV